MSGFEYSALEATGRETRGVIEADTERHARSLLRERGLAPLTVESIRAAAVQSGRRERFSRPGLSRKGLALVTRQFATLVRAGLTIEEGLNVLIEQTESAGARTLSRQCGRACSKANPCRTVWPSFPTRSRRSTAP